MISESFAAEVRRRWREVNERQRAKGLARYGEYRPALDRRDPIEERLKELADAPEYARMDGQRTRWRAELCHVKRWRLGIYAGWLRLLQAVDFLSFALTVAGLRLRRWAMGDCSGGQPACGKGD